MFKNGCLLFCLFITLCCHSQDLSNKGKDFWIAYPAHVDATTSLMGVYITSDEAATGTVQVGAVSVPFSITPNNVKRVFIGPGGDAPNTSVYLSQLDGIATNAGIHVTASRPVVVYAHIIKQFRSGASLLLPATVWGKEYLVPSYPSTGQSGPNSGSASITIVAKDTNTVVEINPKAATQSGRPAGTVYSITLANPGDVYQVQFVKDADISGTTIRSISTNNTTCKPIGVFSASTWSAFDCLAANGGDNLYQQLFPTRAFGKGFITAPFYNRNYDILRVFVTDPTTVVKRTENGVTTTLTDLKSGSFYEFKTNLPNKIDADKPVSVVQFITSQTCYSNSFPADPEMVILSPLEQTINNITVFSAHKNFVPPGQSNVDQCYLNIIIKTAAAASFTINGNNQNGFTAIPGTGYSYLQANVSALSATNPVQTLSADSSFSAIAYGYGNVESYGYNAGTNVRDLYQYITIKNENATINFPATCVNTPFQFAITLPYQATQLTWNFYGKFPKVINSNPAPDSSFVSDGKTLYRYRLSNTYTYDATGSFPVSVSATNPSSDGCNGEQQIDYDLEVYDKPKAFFTWNHHSGCLTDPVEFRDSSNGNGANVNRWRWDFGDNTFSQEQSPGKKYSAGGSFTVKETIITDVGCLADTTAILNISGTPVAGFNISSPLCAGNAIQFTSTATISPGTITRFYWDFGNGRKDSSNTTSPATATYTAGAYTAVFTVESSSGCISAPVSKTFTINDGPVPDFKLPQVICLPAGKAVFTNQSTVANGDINSMIYKWDFGDGGTDNAINPTHIYKIAGPFNIKLTATSSNGCTNDSVKIFTDVFDQPKAVFNLPAVACLGDSSHFTDASTTVNQIITGYGWNFGNNKTDSVKDPTIKYETAASYPVKHWVVSDKGCVSDTLAQNYTVNPLPTAVFTIVGATCENKPFTITSQSIANSGSLNRWHWDFGDGNTKDETNGNPFTYSYSSTGSKTIKLVVISSAGCVSDTFSKAILVNIIPATAFGVPEVCLSDAFAQFTDSSTISDGSEAQFGYAWNFGDANANAGNPNTATQKDSRHRYTLAGNYSVSLTITSKDGCTNALTKSFTVNGDKPKADFDILNPAKLCSNQEVAIVNRSTVNFGNLTKTEIYWEWPSTLVKTTDDIPAPNKTYQHIYTSFQSPATKTYSIRFLAYSGGVCVNEVIKTVTLNAVPHVVFQQVPGFCPDAPARQITQVSTIGNIAGTGTYSGDGISASGLFNPAIAGIGTHNILYSFISTAGCTDTASQNIVVWPAPVADFKVLTPTCAGEAITFHDTSLSNFGKIKTWNWIFGDGNTASRNNGNDFEKTYTNKGSFNVQLQVNTDSGCISSTTSKTIMIHSLPQVDFDIPSLCVNTPAQFTDRSSIADGSENQFTYRWNFGIEGATSTSKNPFFTYPTASINNVRLEVTSKDGCIAERAKAVTDISPQPLANFDFSPLQVCLGESISFTDKSNPLGQGIINWNWNFSDGNISNSQNTTHTYSKSGDYNVSLFYTTSKGCLSDTISRQVIVNPLPLVNAGQDQFLLQGGQKTLAASVSGSSDYSYKWSPPIWLSNANILQPVTSSPADITYTLTVTSLGGCVASDEVLVRFVKAPVIPNAFSPNGDGINDVWEIKYLDSYPGSKVNVFDRYGRNIYSANGADRPWDGTVNGKVLPVGVYYYVVDPKNGKQVLTGSLTIVR